jgi:hypothetical protein
MNRGCSRNEKASCAMWKKLSGPSIFEYVTSQIKLCEMNPLKKYHESVTFNKWRVIPLLTLPLTNAMGWVLNGWYSVTSIPLSHLLGGSYGFGCGGPFCFSGENDSLKLDKDKSLHWNKCTQRTQMRANNRQNDCTIEPLSHYCHRAIVTMFHAWHDRPMACQGKWIVTWPCDGRQTQVMGVVSLVVAIVWVDTTFRTGLVL